MTIYSFTANEVSQSTPVLQKGPISIYASVAVYFLVGENPVADTQRCAVIRANETRRINLPVKCCRVAVLAVSDSGVVTISEESGGASSSCSV